MPRVLLVPCKKNGPENAEAQSFQQIRPRWKLIRAERCVLASSTQWEQPRCTQGPELQEGGLALLFFQRFSCSAHEGSQYVRKHTVFVQPPLLQISAYICSWCLCWARMFSQLWHTMSFNSSPFERQWVRNGSPGASDLRYPNTLFIVAECHVVYSTEIEKRDFVFPSISTTIQRTVCFLHTRTPLFHAFLGWGHKITHIIIPP